jgi:hypothetical protein
MSRSYRRIPITGITTSESDKWFKRSEHRRERRAVRGALDTGMDIPHRKGFGNPWNGSKDGKQWLGDDYPALMRK